jgi:hypothetical protein
MAIVGDRSCNGRCATPGSARLTPARQQGDETVGEERKRQQHEEIRAAEGADDDDPAGVLRIEPARDPFANPPAGVLPFGAGGAADRQARGGSIARASSAQNGHNRGTGGT